MGFIDETGEEVIPCEWIEALDFSEGLAAVKDFHKVIVNPHKWGYIDMGGVIAIRCTWDFADSFHNGVATVKDNKGLFLKIDKDGNIIT